MLNFNIRGMGNTLFKIANDNLNTFYDELFNLEDLIIFAYGTSLDVMDDSIVFE